MAGNDQKISTAPIPEDRSGAQGLKPGKASTPSNASGLEHTVPDKEGRRAPAVYLWRKLKKSHKKTMKNLKGKFPW